MCAARRCQAETETETDRESEWEGATDRQTNMDGNGNMQWSRSWQEIVKTPRLRLLGLSSLYPSLSLPLFLLLSPCCAVLFLQLYFIFLHHRKGFPTKNKNNETKNKKTAFLLARFMFLDELKSHMQIKFSCFLVCCPLNPQLHPLPSLCCPFVLFCGFYISIESSLSTRCLKYLQFFFFVSFVAFSFSFPFFRFEISIKFISYVNDDVLLQLYPGEEDSSAGCTNNGLACLNKMFNKLAKKTSGIICKGWWGTQKMRWAIDSTLCRAWGWAGRYNSLQDNKVWTNKWQLITVISILAFINN